MKTTNNLPGVANGLASLSLYNVAFTVTDLEASIDWYCKILNFKLVSKTEWSVGSETAKVAIIDGAGMFLELLQFPVQHRIDDLLSPMPDHLIGTKAIVFQVEDLALATKTLEDKGVQFVWKNQYLAGDSMLSTMITDIDGNKINIFQADTTIPRLFHGPLADHDKHL
ncbi:Catechol 2,3-dioxygenase [Chitinophaga sp. YR573]|uniref:VOC family protein n=1 Tax=Chitinophaga sp. YR573 TaxID=1881040 RepID=UPI0008D78900|nr:VOC family protein [Chitinophaga sp. YR573]SEW38821.1 Catechol 2,3-dioxygenase [Chitinophaga sp. YR573]